MIGEFKQPDSVRCGKLPEEFFRTEKPGQRVIRDIDRFGLKIVGEQSVIVFAVIRVESVVPEIVPVVADRAAAPGE